MKNTKLKISVSLILIITLLTIPALSTVPNSHTQFICNDCHNGRFSYGAEETGDDCGNCHDYRDATNKMDIPKLEAQHNPNTCKICHEVKDLNVFHTIHGNVSGSCTRCHGDNGNAIPDKTINECSGCHGGQVHVIHKDNLTQICPKCHSSRPASNPASGSTLSTNEVTPGIYAKVVNYKQFTLYEVFQRILSSYSI
ncbi:MAG: hypothetical protein WCE94_13295 [Candidatus Methanoperedens sp.]